LKGIFLVNEWLDELADLGAAGDAAVVVTMAAVRGSAPREPGAKMIVTAAETIGTIGGGQLEYQCARLAVGMLGANELPSMRRFPLGAAMGQCCGGVVEVLFEPLDQGLPSWLAELRALHGQRLPAVLVTGIGESAGKFVVTADSVFGPDPDGPPAPVLAASRGLLAAGGQAGVCGNFLLEPVVASAFNSALFGAGHVGAAVTQALSRIDCNIRWIDSRRRVFRDLPRNVRAIESDDPPLEVGAMPAGSYYLVMTHSHALDFAVCERVLGRPDIAYCGLIGSLAKRRRFEKRFRAQGMGEAALARLTCPIGLPGIRGKKPAEIALATAAELLHVRDSGVAFAAAGVPENVRPFRRR
jgi:xanthine dehydrogenase accessory factor